MLASTLAAWLCGLAIDRFADNKKRSRFFLVLSVVLLLAEKLIWGKLLRKLPKLLQWLYAMFFVVVGWVLFDLTDFAQLKYALGIMFSYTPTNWSLLLASDTTKLFSAIFIIPAIIFSFPVAKKLRVGDGTVSNVAVNIVCLLLLAACIMFIISSSYNPFIYFRF